MGYIRHLSKMVFAPWIVPIRHSALLFELLRQEIRLTYARTILGFYWILLLPLFYTLVFIGVRFVALDHGSNQWLSNQISQPSTIWSAFALTTGLLVFWLGSEILTRAPVAVRRHSSLVTEMYFPVELLPWITIGLSIFNFVVRFALLVVAYLLFIGIPYWEIMLVPFAIMPMLVIMISVTYLFSAIGVFISDLEFVIQILMTALLLMSGVIFPLTMVPEPYRTILYINPIAVAINEARKLGLDGQNAEWTLLGITFIFGLIMISAAYAFFKKMRPRFSEAL